MKFKVLIATALLGIALSAAADTKLIQRAYEVALSDLRLPQEEGGALMFKSCDDCEYLRVRVGTGTTYRLNGQVMSLTKFRAALLSVEDREGQPVTVLHHLELDLVTNVAVNL
jgi:hypothetical protein